MITPLSNIKILNKVKIFNIDIKEKEKKNLSTILETIQPILNSSSNNSIYIFKDGQIIHSEALLSINGKLRNTKAIGTSIEESIEGLIPQIIKVASETSGQRNINFKKVG